MFSKVSKFIPAFLGLPFVALAQVTDVQSGFSLISDIIRNYIVPLIIGLAVLYFLWGVLQYVLAGGDEEKRKLGRDHMIYGVIAIFVMISIWGLVGVLRNTTGLTTNVPPPLPITP